MLQPLAKDIWVVDGPLKFLGLAVGTRMTIVRLPEGGLLLHSPVAPTTEVLEQVRALGEVRYLVAPNRYHHLFVGKWQSHFPAAEIYVAPGLEKKRADLSIAGILGGADRAPWSSVLSQVQLEGCPLLNEVDFFHPASGTLIVTDLAFNIGPKSPAATRCAFRLAGSYGSVRPTYFERLIIRDRNRFRSTLQSVLQWDFQRIVLAHGEVCEGGAREQLKAGYAWLL